MIALCATLILSALLASGCRAGGASDTAATAVVEVSPAGTLADAASQSDTGGPRTTPVVRPSNRRGGTAVIPISATGTGKTSAESFQRLQSENAPIVQELDEAYLKFWRVYVDAAATGDTSRLQEVLAGQALQGFTEYIRQNEAKGRGIEGKYQHAVAYTGVTATSANVIDRITDSSTYIDLRTGRRSPRTSPPSMYVLTFRMEKIDGTWKVVNQQRSGALP